MSSRPHYGSPVAARLNELEAENQQLRDDVEGYRIEVERRVERANKLLAENQRLRDAIEEYILWEPCKRGHAAAHRKLCEALAGDAE